MGKLSDFDIALAAGQETERLFQRLMLMDAATVEVKDQRNSKTHVFIEHEDRGHPSGIAVTKADWWAILVAVDRFVIIATNDLRDMHDQAIARYGVKHGGDGGAAYGAAVPKAWLVELPF